MTSKLRMSTYKNHIYSSTDQTPLAQKAKSAAVFDVILFCICHDMGFRKRRTINMKNMIYHNCCTMKPMNGARDLLIQNWFYKKSKGRQCKGRRPRNFDFFQLILNAPCLSAFFTWYRLSLSGLIRNLQI